MEEAANKLNSEGYYIGNLSKGKLIESIKLNIINNIQDRVPGVKINNWTDLVDNYEKWNIHEKIKNKSQRLIPKSNELNKIEELITEEFEDIIGIHEISDEEDYGYSEVYWRIVRPNQPKDVGPLHADSWFWVANNWEMKKPWNKRTKVWIPLACETGKNGLLVIPGTHTQEDIRYQIKQKDGKGKPIISTKFSPNQLKLLPTPVGSYVCFDDNLIHGGAPNKGERVRISIEFTLLHKNNE